MTYRIFIMILMMFASPLLAQDRFDPAQFKKSDLSMTLRGIAAHDLHYPPEQIGQLITKGLAGSADEREAALYAIAGRSGILMPQTPENLAAWAVNRSMLLSFRNQVEQTMTSDSDPSVREAAVMALAGLAQRHEKGEWLTELDDKEVAFMASAFRRESFAGARANILRLVVHCQSCPTTNLDARKQLVRDAIYDAGLVELALYGAGQLKIADVLDYAAMLLANPDPGRRAAAAKTLGLFGRDGARYRGALQDALSQEKMPEVRGIMEGAVAAMDSEP